VRFKTGKLMGVSRRKRRCGSVSIFRDHGGRLRKAGAIFASPFILTRGTIAGSLLLQSQIFCRGCFLISENRQVSYTAAASIPTCVLWNRRKLPKRFSAYRRHLSTSEGQIGRPCMVDQRSEEAPISRMAGGSRSGRWFISMSGRRLTFVRTEERWGISNK
jgi:hypothetical protein